MAPGTREAREGEGKFLINMLCIVMKEIWEEKLKDWNGVIKILSSRVGVNVLVLKLPRNT